MRQKWLASEQECQRLHSALDKAHHEIAGLDRKLRHARRNLEEESRKRRIIEEQKDSLVAEIYSRMDILKIYIFFSCNNFYSYLFFRRNKSLQPEISCLLTEVKT